MKKLLKKLGKRSADAGTSDAESSDTGTSSPRSERYGLLPLGGSTPSADRPELYPVDIVAIHGLAGDAYTTWTHEKGLLWLRDLLPDFLPGCRVFTYGYPSQAAFSTSFARVQEYARGLLSSLRDAQEDSNENPRPIIFVCHSLGGIVCKQALVFAHEDNGVYGRLLKSVAGVIFLGTPHRGSSAATLGTVVGRIVNTFMASTTAGLQTKAIRTDLLDYLRYDSKDLQDLTISVRNRLADLAVISFYESEAQPPLSLIVDRASAVLNIPGEEIIPLYANHRDLCRFAGETSEYTAVSRAVRRIARATQQTTSRESTHSSQRTLNDSEKSCMRLFNYFDVSDYQTRLSRPANGTCQWILAHPLFVSWLERAENALLWLTGHPGCGKTILSLSLAKQLEAGLASRRPSNVCIFFCDDKISKQRDAKNILIGLILQLIHRHRSLVRHANKAYEMQGQSIVRSFTALWNLFVKLVTDSRSGPTYVIIDGLDECEAVTRSSLLESIRSFVQTLDRPILGMHHVKFVLTSRPSLAEISRSIADCSEQQIPIDEGQGGYEEDLRTFIHQRVNEMSQQRNFPPEVRDFLEQTLYSKSGQTFLWIHMVLVSLENNPLSSRKDLQDIMTRIPAGLETTYMGFLSAIPAGYQDIASRLLKLILGSSRPLTLDEVNIALTISPSYRTAEELASGCQTAILHTLQGVLGPLVRVSDSRVTLVHQSAKEFILQHVGSGERLFPAIRAIRAEDCALVIASACIDYLLLDDFAEDVFSLQRSPTHSISGASDVYENSPVSSSGKPFWDEDAEDLNADMIFGEPNALVETARQLLVSKHAFFRYSAENWAEHFAVCETSAPIRLREAAKSLLDKNATYCSNWLRYFTAGTATQNQDIPHSLDTTSLAAYFNLHETLKDRLGSQNTVPQADVDCALFWGSEQGHSRVVDTLLRAGADPNAHVSGGQTALLAASRNGYLNCVATLLACDRTDLNMRGKSGRTALSFACGGGYMEIAQALLRRRDCKPGEEDDSGATPLFWAAGGGHARIVTLLAREPAVEVNHRDKKGRTTLSWAAGDGMADLVGTLLKLRGIDVNLKDGRGRSPLLWAAGNGHTAVVRVLLRDRRTDKASVDSDRRNAISWASGGGHVDTLRALLKYGCPGVDDRDVDGWSPLAWAVQNNSPDTVEALTSSRTVNLEQGDHSKRTALSWAVEYGHLEVVRTLLRAGANPNSRSETGITPLSTAERFGRNEIRDELLSCTMNVLG